MWDMMLASNTQVCSNRVEGLSGLLRANRVGDPVLRSVVGKHDGPVASVGAVPTIGRALQAYVDVVASIRQMYFEHLS